MTNRTRLTIAAHVVEFLQKLDGFMADAAEHICMSYMAKTQMRLVPIRTFCDRTDLR